MNVIPLIVTSAITILSGSAAVALAAKTRGGPVAEILARIALLGAAAVFALLGAPG